MRNKRTRPSCPELPLPNKQRTYIVCQLKILLAGELKVHPLHQLQDLQERERERERERQRERQRESERERERQRRRVWEGGKGSFQERH